VPSVVVDASDGAEYRCSADGVNVSGGVLITSGEVAGVEAKQNLVARFHGLVVDMEAAGVARVAQQARLDFRCVKAISDEADFVMPPMARFVDAAGTFANRQICTVGNVPAMAMAKDCGPGQEQPTGHTSIVWLAGKKT